MASNIDLIKKIREETAAPIADIKNALEASKGDEAKAKDWLRKKGFERGGKKASREIKVERVFSYEHHTGAVGGTVVLGCETDFVAKTDDFKWLGKELAMQAASTAGTVSADEFKKQEYIRDSSKTVGALVQEMSGKLGENLQIAYMRHDPEK